jgi:hypothetical protein
MFLYFLTVRNGLTTETNCVDINIQAYKSNNGICFQIETHYWDLVCVLYLNNYNFNFLFTNFILLNYI